MGIAAQLLERVDLSILSAEVSQKKSNSCAIGRDGCITYLSRHRFHRWLEELGQRVCGERKTLAFHDCFGGVGRVS